MKVVLCETETDKDRPAQLRLGHNAVTDYERDGNAAVLCETETDKDRPAQLRLVHNVVTDYERDGNAAVLYDAGTETVSGGLYVR